MARAPEPDGGQQPLLRVGSAISQDASAASLNVCTVLSKPPSKNEAFLAPADAVHPKAWERFQCMQFDILCSLPVIMRLELLSEAGSELQ